MSDTLGASNKLKILQIRLRHCKQANEALEDYVLNNGVNIILDQDPYVLNSVVVSIPSDWSSYLSTKNTALSILLTGITFVLALSQEKMLSLST